MWHLGSTCYQVTVTRTVNVHIDKHWHFFFLITFPVSSNIIPFSYYHILLATVSSPFLFIYPFTVISKQLVLIKSYNAWFGDAFVIISAGFDDSLIYHISTSSCRSYISRSAIMLIIRHFSRVILSFIIHSYREYESVQTISGSGVMLSCLSMRLIVAVIAKLMLILFVMS